MLYKPLYFFYKKITESDRIKLMEAHIDHGMTVLDIGANIGFYTHIFSHLTGGESATAGKVYAFEPDPVNFAHLERVTVSCENVVLTRAAVGETSGKTRLFISEDMNVDHKTYDDGENRKSIDVETCSIDDFLQDVDKVDIIKIDVQGFDYYAVKGMRETIKRSEKIVIFGEFWPFALKQAGVEPEEYLLLLESFGLTVRLLGLNREDIKGKCHDKSYFTDYIAEK